MTDYLERAAEVTGGEIAEVLDQLSFWSSRFGRLLFDHLEPRRELTILDVGCATGFPLFELAHAHGPSCRLWGIDVWTEALVRAEAKRRVFRLSNVRLARADAARLPFRDAAFDLAVSNLGLNNFADPEAAVAECARVLRPGGRLALTTNLRGHMRELYDAFRDVLAELGRTEALERLEHQESHRGSERTLVELLEPRGFRVERTVRDRFVMRYADGGALLRHWLTVVGFLEGWRGVVDPADEEETFRRLEARLDRIAVARGGLAMTVPQLYVESRRR